MVSTLSKQDAAFILKLAVHRGQIAVPQPETPQSPASSGSLGSASVSPTLDQGKPASLVLEMLNLKFLRPLEFSLFRILHRSLQELLKAFFFSLESVLVKINQLFIWEWILNLRDIL